jgi:hypothetical protein
MGGVIEGTLVERTAGASLQGGAKAYLYKVSSGQQPRQVGEAAADSAGRFEFDFVELDPAAAYKVAVEYQGAPYFSDNLTFPAGETSRKLSIDVYEPTDDDKVLSLAGTSLLVDADEKSHELAILELDSFQNDSQRTFVPSTTPRGSGPPPILRFSLPQNATNLTPGEGMGLQEIIQINGGFGALVPVAPGRHDLGFAYRSAYQRSSTSFSKTIIYPTKTLRVLVPAGKAQVDSPQLVRQPRQNVGGKQYDLLLGSDLAPGTKVELRFSSLPGVSPLSELAQPSTLPWLAGVLAVVTLGMLGWYVRDRLRRPVSAPALDRQQLEAQRRELLITLARLDDRFDEGKIAASDYQDQREVQKAELRAIMQQLEALN